MCDAADKLVMVFRLFGTFSDQIRHSATARKKNVKDPRTAAVNQDRWAEIGVGEVIGGMWYLIAIRIYIK